MNRRSFLQKAGLAALCAPFVGFVTNAHANHGKMRTTYKVGLISWNNDSWFTTVNHSECTLKDLKQGNYFEMYEYDGTKVTDDQGYSIFHAEQDPYMREDGLWTIESTPIG